MKLTITIALLAVFGVVSAQAATVAIKDMTLVQESGSVASIGNMPDGHHGENHHGGHHGDNHHGGHHGGHHGVKASKTRSNLPSPQIKG
jgi:hypothetical protein